MLLTRMLSGDDAQDPVSYVQHHALDNMGIDAFLPFGGDFRVTKFSILAVLAGLILFGLARLAVRRRSAVPTGVLQNAFEGLVVSVRDEMVRPAMGHHGDKFVPFFCTIFSFILVSNLMGVLPLPTIAGTPTSNLAMTGMLAVSVFCVSVFGGIAAHGFRGFLHNFIPPGLPGWLRPMLFVLEVIGFLIKHSVLAVRLFANMLAGHLVVGTFLALIFMAGAHARWQGYAVAVPAVALALFVNLLEILVCFLQAYVFTLLSVLFVGGTVHPEH